MHNRTTGLAFMCPLLLSRLVAGGMQYYAAVSHTDEQIGRVLDELRQSGLRKSTVVCFFT